MEQRGGLAPVEAEYRVLDKIFTEARVFRFRDQSTLWFGAASLPAVWLCP